MKHIKAILLLVFFYNPTSILHAQFGVDDTRDANQLVNILTNNSPCIIVSNAVVSGDTFTSGKNSTGQFTNSGTPFPFSGGVILSTWSATNAVGGYIPNQRGGGDGRWLGDSDLNQALGIATVNASVLEFDFVALTNSISFNYVFASNEYQSYYPCKYSDGFAFLIKEVGTLTPYKNLAVLPGTTTTVSSTEIRPTISGVGNVSGCPAKNETFFNGYNTSSSPINYAGQVKKLTASTDVKLGKKYHIKLVIADDQRGESIFDSSIFLEAGSFSQQLNIGNDRTIKNNNPVCFGEIYTIDTQLPSTYNYKWFKNGVEIIGETNSTLNIKVSGIYKVEIFLSPSTCNVSDEIVIEYSPQITVNNTTLTQCDDNGDGISVFDLTKADNIIKNNDTSLSPVVYYESLPDAKGNINPILNPSTYSNKPTIPILFARVTNTFNCANYAQVSLVIANNSIAPQNPVSTCDGDTTQDGLYQFDLNVQVTPQVLNGLPAGLIAEYYLTTSDAILQKNSQPNIFKNTTTNQQIIYARIINGADCYGIIPITLMVNTFNPPNFQDETAAVCLGFSTNLGIASGYSSYLWNTGGTSNSINVINSGNYSVTVTNANGCKAIKKFTVTSSGVATITGAIVNDFAGNDNSVLLQYTGIGNNYEFSLNSSFFQDNPLFTGIAPGNYLGYARDKNGCGLSIPFEIYVLDYPRFFTPNGDGFNDVWKIKNLDLFSKATLTIYDRFGKFLKELNAINPSWNGTCIGNDLPADDYWFHLNFDNGKIIKGHFSLKR